MIPCKNIKCPHYRVRKEIDYTATMGNRNYFSLRGMPKMESYGECKYPYCKLMDKGRKKR